MVEWLVAPGQQIAADEPIVEVSTDKADVVIPSPLAGTVVRLGVEAGRAVPVGTTLAEIEDGELADEGDAAPKPVALPGVRGLARRLGVDLTTVPPSGPNGRVTEADVEAAAGGQEAGSRATIARRLTAAAAVPTVTNVDAADFEAVRAAGRSPLGAFTQAVVLALRDHPRLNAWRLEDGSVVESTDVHVGVATQTEKGLLVPVVRDAHLLAVDDLEVALATSSDEARTGRAHPDQLRGSTITVTSAGRQAGMFATPLLNLPEVAIVGLYRIEPRPVVRDDTVVVRRMANLSVTFDHRALDGMHAADFLARVIEIIERWPQDLPESRP